MMDSKRPEGAAPTSLNDMLDHRLANGDDDDDQKAAAAAVNANSGSGDSPNGVVIQQHDYHHHHHKTVPAVYVPLIDTSEDCLFRTPVQKRDRPGKCVRFNEQTENFYVPAIVIDGPEHDDLDDDEDEELFVDSLSAEVAADAGEYDTPMGNAQTSIPTQNGGQTLEDERSSLPSEDGVPSDDIDQSQCAPREGVCVRASERSDPRSGNSDLNENGCVSDLESSDPLSESSIPTLESSVPLLTNSSAPHLESRVHLQSSGDGETQSKQNYPTPSKCNNNSAQSGNDPVNAAITSRPLKSGGLHRGGSENCGQDEGVAVTLTEQNHPNGDPPVHSEIDSKSMQRAETRNAKNDGDVPEENVISDLEGENVDASENESTAETTLLTDVPSSVEDGGGVAAPVEMGQDRTQTVEKVVEAVDVATAQMAAVQDRQQQQQQQQQGGGGERQQVLQLQVAELGAQLSAREKEAAHLRGKLVALEQEAADKRERELELSRKESEEAKEKLKRVQSDLDTLRTSNDVLNKKLTDKLQQDVKDGQTLETLTARVAELEKQLEETRAERAALEEALAKAVAEVEAERDALDEALEEALEDTSQRFQKEFEELRTVHADREQQLLADLEWKLREVQASGKKKVDEKDRTLRELLAKVTNLEEMASQAGKNAAAARAETEQLRGLNIEQQRALRLNTRDMEQLQVNEKVLKEEVTRLRAALDREKVHIDSILERHSAELVETEREYQTKIEQVKVDTADMWETRMHAEIIRLQTDLEQSHAEDKVAALHTQARELREDADRYRQQLRESLDLAETQVETLRQKLIDREAQLNRELERLQTNADRDIFELRRQLDKIDLKYQEQIEVMGKRHEDETEKLRTEHEKRMAACEQGYQLQSASTRATLELAKEQMRRESDASRQELEEQHRRKLEEQVQSKRRLEAQVSQLSQAVATAKEAEPKQEQLALQVSTLQTELKQAASSHKEALRRVEEEATRNVRAKETELSELRRQAEEARRRADQAKEVEEKVAKQQQRIDALTAQLKGRPEDRAVIEDLRRTLVAKDAALERLRSTPRPEDAMQLQQLKDSVTEHKAIIEQLRLGQGQAGSQAEKLRAALAEREAVIKEKEATIKERDAALRKSQSNPRPQDSQKLDELRKMLKEKDMEINRLNNEELAPLRKKAQEASEKDAELQKVRAEAVQVKESMKQIAELKKALGEKEEAIAKLGQQLSQRQREDSNKKLKQQAAQVEDLKRGMAEKEAALSKASAEIAQLQKNLTERSRSGRAEDAVQIAALKKSLAEREKVVLEKDKAVAESEKAMAEMGKVAAERDKAVTEKLDLAARLEAARRTARPEDAARMAEMQKTLAAKDEEIGRLRETAKKPGDITEMQRALRTRDDEIARLKDAVRARHGPHETELRRQLAERDAALNRLQEENRRIQIELVSRDSRSATLPAVPTSIPVAAVQPQQQHKQQQPQQHQQQQPPTVMFKPQTPAQQQPTQCKQQPTAQQPSQPQPQQEQLNQQAQLQQQQQQQQQPQQQTQQQSQQNKSQPPKAANIEPEEKKRAVPTPHQAAAAPSRRLPWTPEPLRQATENPGRPQHNSNNSNTNKDIEPTEIEEGRHNTIQPPSPVRRVLVQRKQLQPQEQHQQQQKQTGRPIRRLSENVEQQQQCQQQRQTPPAFPRRNSALPTPTRRETVLISFPT